MGANFRLQVGVHHASGACIRGADGCQGWPVDRNCDGDVWSLRRAGARHTALDRSAGGAGRRARRYSAYLGVLGAVPPEIFRGEQARWLGVEVAGHELPRMMLVAVPYAIHAADADALGGQPASSFVRSRADGKLETSAGIVVANPLVDGSGVPNQLTKWAAPDFLSSSTVTETASNRIGFGLTDPTGGGVVDSVFTIRNFDNNTGFGILNQSQQRRFAINTLASGGWSIYDGGGGAWNLGLSQVSGRVGINNAAPTHALHVGSTSSLGSVRIDGPFNAAAGAFLRWTENFDPTFFHGFEAQYDGSANRLVIRSLISSVVGVDNVLVLDRDSGFVGMGIAPLDNCTSPATSASAPGRPAASRTQTRRSSPACAPRISGSRRTSRPWTRPREGRRASAGEFLLARR